MWSLYNSVPNFLYMPIIAFCKIQYWLDNVCIQLQLPRGMDKYRLWYEHRRVGGHLKGHSQELAYLRIAPTRRTPLFSTYK
jgi:hypothetical protein